MSDTLHAYPVDSQNSHATLDPYNGPIELLRVRAVDDPCDFMPPGPLGCAPELIYGPVVEENTMSRWVQLRSWSLAVGRTEAGRLYWEPGRYRVVANGVVGPGVTCAGPRTPPPRLPPAVSVWAKDMCVRYGILPPHVSTHLREEVAAVRARAKGRGHK